MQEDAGELDSAVATLSTLLRGGAAENSEKELAALVDELENLRAALGEKRGVCRYGDIVLPMDEALVLCAVDLSGRSCLRFGLEIPTEKVGTFDTELVEEFFLALCREAGLTLHLRQLDGTNSHHIIEAAFKAFARALREAVSIDPAAADAVPSTKGVLV